MVRHQGINRALGQAGLQGLAVALLAQGRVEPGPAVEVTDIAVDQVQRVDADIATQAQALALGLPHQGYPGGTAQATQVHAHASGPHQLENRVQGNRLGSHRNAAQAHAGSQGATRGNTSP